MKGIDTSYYYEGYTTPEIILAFFFGVGPECHGQSILLPQ